MSFKSGEKAVGVIGGESDYGDCEGVIWRFTSSSSRWGEPSASVSLLLVCQCIESPQ